MHQEDFEVIIRVLDDARVWRLQMAYRIWGQEDKLKVLGGGTFRVGGALIHD